MCLRRNVCVKIQFSSNVVVLQSCPHLHIIFYWLKKKRGHHLFRKNDNKVKMIILSDIENHTAVSPNNLSYSKSWSHTSNFIDRHALTHICLAIYVYPERERDDYIYVRQWKKDSGTERNGIMTALDTKIFKWNEGSRRKNLKQSIQAGPALSAAWRSAADC